MSLVLVVDDEPDVRLMLRMALRLAGHDVAEADTGRAAIAMVSDTPFDAVVLDIHLPDVLGWEVLDRIHASPARGQTPVIIVTADVTQGDDAPELHAGDPFWELIYKPMDPDDLVVAIDRAVDRV